MPTVHRNIFNIDILRTKNSVRPVAGVPYGVSAERNIFTEPEVNPMRSSVALFTFWVKAVFSVNP